MIVPSLLECSLFATCLSPPLRTMLPASAAYQCPLPTMLRAMLLLRFASCFIPSTLPQLQARVSTGNTTVSPPAGRSRARDRSRSRSPPRRQQRAPPNDRRDRWPEQTPAMGGRDSGYPGRQRASPSFRAGASNKASACAICLGRHRHSISTCIADRFWDGSGRARCSRNGSGQIVTPENQVLCIDWQRPDGCQSTTHDVRHECSGCGKKSHGAQTCPRAEKV